MIYTLTFDLKEYFIVNLCPFVQFGLLPTSAQERFWMRRNERKSTDE